MLDIVAGEASKDRFRIGSAQAQRGNVLHHFVVLLANHLPVDWLGQDQPQVWVGVRLSGIGTVELLLADGFQRGRLKAQ